MNSEAKQILFLPSWYPNRTAPSLGNFIQRHAEAVSELHEVAVLYAVADPDLKDTYEVETTNRNGVVEVIVYYKKVSVNIPFLSSFIKYKRFVTAYRKGYEQLQYLMGTPDLLHVHVIWRAAIFARSLFEKLRIPMVISEHWSGYMPEDGSYGSSAPMKAYTQAMVRNAGAVIAVSERMKGAMLSHGLKNDYHIIPNVVDTKLFHPAPSSPQGKIRMLHVSTVNDREKNISGMLRVIKKLSEKRNDIILEIIGDSPERMGFEKMAREMGLNDHVIFTGYKSIDEVAERMRASHFFVMFSNYEGLPCVILEAMASGLPVVATRTGGIPSVMDDDKGILVEVKDEEALLHAIDKMIDKWNTFDRTRLRKYAEDNFSYHNVGRQIADVYEKVLEQKRS